MFKNYFKAAFRSIRKNPQFSTLNILGLAIGITIVSLLLLYLNDEWSFDKYHSNFDQIHRVIVNADLGDETETWANAPNAVGPTALENIPGVKEQIRMLKHNFGDLAFVQVGGEKYVQDNLYWIDSSLLNIFDLDIIAGGKTNALHEPNQVMLSESVSKKLFKEANPIGQIVNVDHEDDLKVTAVYRDLPQNSSFDAEMIGSFATTNFSKQLSWSNSSFETYLLLEPGTSPPAVEKELALLVERNVEEEGRWYTLALQPLSDIHLGSAHISSSYTSRLGDPSQLQLLFYLAIVILFIASINYMNLATARSDQRIKEVAINKTIGAGRGLIMARFYLETAVLVAIAVLISLVLLSVGMPYFNMLADKSFVFADLMHPFFIGGILAVSAVIVLLSGAYPALYLSNISPTNLFRQNNGAASGASGVFRRGLVIAQFIASIFIIVATLAFYNQLQFIQDKNLGYQAEQVVAIYTAGAEDGDQVRALVNQLTALPEVGSVSLAQTFPGKDGSGRSLSKPQDDNRSIILQTNRADDQFIDALSLNLIAGRGLPEQGVSYDDSIVHVILNEKAIAFLEYDPEDAIGKEAPGVFWGKRSEIVGVVEDFHFESFHQPIGAYIVHNNPSEWRNYALVKLKTSALRTAMQKVEGAFNNSIPNSAFEYTFLDDHLDRLYASEDRTARIFMLFGGISIFIACLGLFGLTAYRAERRKKEIGIRKVLGARVSSIIYLLSKEFLLLVVVALVIAIPISWYFIGQWKNNFAYTAEFSWGSFVLAGAVAILVALITIGYQARRAAVNDPIESLRNE